MKKSLSICYLVLIFGILYIPILTLILFSFNSANSTANFDGFSLRWYIELFNSPDAFEALRNSLILAYRNCYRYCSGGGYLQDEE